MINIVNINLKRIKTQMAANKREALQALKSLNKKISDHSDQDSFDEARLEIENLFQRGFVSRRLKDHMMEEISCVYQPNKYIPPKKGMHDFGTLRGIKEYMAEMDDWILKEILIWNAIALTQNTALSTCLFNLDAHFSVGDIPKNLLPLAKAWYCGIAREYTNEA